MPKRQNLLNLAVMLFAAEGINKAPLAPVVDCSKCHWMKNRVSPRDDALHCYMFAKAPDDNRCAQFKAET